MQLRSGSVIGDGQLIVSNSHNAIPQNSESIYNEDHNLNNEQVTSPISPCGDCITCKSGYFKADPVYTNKVTGKQFTATETLNCQSTSVVYLISCGVSGCPLQYVGQTVNTLNTRCIQHRSGLKNGNEPKFVREHFTKVHQISE